MTSCQICGDDYFPNEAEEHTHEDEPLGKGQQRISWPTYALHLAHAARIRSEDPHHQVGTVLLRHDMTVAAVGYNGAPAGMEIDWSDRDARRSLVIHAEANALRYVRPGEIAIMATTMMPCLECLKLAIAYDIREIVYGERLDPEVYDVSAILDMATRAHVTSEKR